jgi:hypothetical protein
MKLIDEHFRWMKDGKMNYGGLCGELVRTKYQKSLYRFIPSIEELRQMGGDVLFWGNQSGRAFIYDLRRQTIVLFICAMHGEI